MVIYDYHPQSITYSLRYSCKVQAVEDHMKNKPQVLQLLKENLNVAQNQMKQQVDQHRSERIFNEGD